MSESPDEIPPRAFQESLRPPGAWEPAPPTFEELAADPEIAALLDFEPVLRKRHSEHAWTPERQREFIARVASHGSANKACDEMGKSRTGMEKLYRSPLAGSFRAARHAAGELAQRRRDEAVPEGPPAMIRPPTIDHRVKHGRYALARPAAWDDHDQGCPHCGDEYSAERRRLRERAESLRRIRGKLFMARRVYLLSIADDSERRAAWELLCGPADWDAAAAMQPQPDENDGGSTDLSGLKRAGWQVPLVNGYLPDLTDPEYEPGADPRSSVRGIEREAQEVEGLWEQLNNVVQKDLWPKFLYFGCI